MVFRSTATYRTSYGPPPENENEQCLLTFTWFQIHMTLFFHIVIRPYSDSS